MDNSQRLHRSDDENTEDHAKGGDTNNNRCNSGIYLPQVVGEGATEKQQHTLQHQWQQVHDVVKIPHNNAVELVLPILAAFNCGSSHISGSVLVQPLFAKHCKEGRQEGDSEACVKDGLDLDN